MKYGKLQLHHVWLFVTNHILIFSIYHAHFCLYSVPHYIIFFFIVFVLFFHFASYISIPVLYLGSIPFTFHLSPLSYLSFFPLELSLHTIANNLVKESHLCSHAFSINSPPFFPSLFLLLVFSSDFYPVGCHSYSVSLGAACRILCL